MRAPAPAPGTTFGAASGLLVIPARFGSTRLPGKPLVPIAGRTLLSRVLDVARAAAVLAGDLDVLVATDDARIADRARDLGCAAVMTPAGISSGSGRVLAAATASGHRADLLVNLQGDAPFVAPAAVAAVVAALRDHPEPVATPVVQLGWDRLDALRAHKRAEPFSGTTCIRGEDGRAIWFSKAILPAIRDEVRRRATQPLSPVLQHVGLYGYRRAALERFEAAPPSAYEVIESLEQLRLIALGIPIRLVEVAWHAHVASGIDTPADVALAEALIAAHGEPGAA